MAIRHYKSLDKAADKVGHYPAGNSMAALAGDVMGNTTGGLLSRRATAGTITAAGGILGFLVHSLTTDANGVASTPAAPTGVHPAVVPKLALTQYADRMSMAPPISAAQRSMGMVYLANPFNVFIQRHKIGTRVNIGLVGKKCDFTWNTTTLEWEVDTTVTTVGMIEITEVPAHYMDNRTYYDSATFATDTKNAWVAFMVDPLLYAQAKGLSY